MKITKYLVALGILGSAAAFAQAPAASVTAVCKDGTPFSGTTLKGACRGHGGVDKKASKADAAPVAAPAAASAPAAAAAAAPAKAPANTAAVAAAPGGGAGKVWGNDESKVYHCANDRYYGKTKKGEYMTEAEAKAKGFHASHGKACS